MDSSQQIGPLPPDGSPCIPLKSATRREAAALAAWSIPAVLQLTAAPAAHASTSSNPARYDLAFEMARGPENPDGGINYRGRMRSRVDLSKSESRKALHFTTILRNDGPDDAPAGTRLVIAALATSRQAWRNGASKSARSADYPRIRSIYGNVWLTPGRPPYEERIGRDPEEILRVSEFVLSGPLEVGESIEVAWEFAALFVEGWAEFEAWTRQQILPPAGSEAGQRGVVLSEARTDGFVLVHSWDKSQPPWTSSSP